MQKLPLIVIGAGPAGLMAAFSAAETGIPVVVLEYLARPGRKLLASGAGKCNFTNILEPEAMTERFPPEQRRFVRPALLGFPPARLRAFLRERGVETVLVDDFYCFPASERAGDILNVLLDALRNAGGRIVTEAPVANLEVVERRVAAVWAGGVRHACSGVVLAAGGPAYPELGGRASLDAAAAAAGMVMKPRVPALCGLKIGNVWSADLAGIVLDDVTLTLDAANVARGTMLFTQEGVSGPAALDLGGRAARRLAEGMREVVIKLNFRAEYTRDMWRKLLDGARQSSGTRQLRNLFAHHLPQAVARMVCEDSGCGDRVAARLDGPARDCLLDNLCGYGLRVVRTENWNRAMASSGGVDRSEINARTMACRRYENVFAAGEFMDVDGPCGGYNLQWAFSSGRLAGRSAAAAVGRMAELGKLTVAGNEE